MTMNTDRLPRKLAAILHADVVGFSRLTEQDEDATLRGLKECFSIFTSAIGRYRGRVISHAGDAVLAIFGSALDAMSCAAHIQAALAECNDPLPEERRIRFRIGLNLGDVVADHGDVYGDGVNVAARLQSLAEPAGICISGSVYDAIGQRLPFDCEFLGEQSVKNIAKPVRAYHARLKPGTDLSILPAPATSSWLPTQLVVPAVVGLILIAAAVGIAVWQSWIGNHTAPRPGASQPGLAALPTVAVLPFVNRSDDPEQDYFAEGVSEDIITDLSGLSGLVVVARSASFRYKGVEVVPQSVGKELGADYLLEGSVRKAGGYLRITAQLVDTHNGTQRWAERYDRQAGGAFAFQDDVTRNIVKAMAIRLTAREEQNLGRIPTANFEAYDQFLQGQKLFFERTLESNKLAQAAYRRAIELDPNFARAYGALAVTLAYARQWLFTDTTQDTLDRALAMANKAVELDPESPQVYWALGFVHLFRKEYEVAAKAVERSIALAPNYADGYGLLAFINNHLGRADEAVRLVTKAMALNPHYSWDYPWNLGWASYTLKRYPEAVDALKRALERNESVLPPRLYLAASYEALGRHDDARWEIDQVRVINPRITLSEVTKTSAVANPELLNRLLTHLRDAGLPE
jgi:adenylate cyclase